MKKRLELWSNLLVNGKPYSQFPVVLFGRRIIAVGRSYKSRVSATREGKRLLAATPPPTGADGEGGKR